MTATPDDSEQITPSPPPRAVTGGANQGGEGTFPTSSCFGPAFTSRFESFVQWPITMDLRLHRLGLDDERISVLRALLGFWSPDRDIYEGSVLVRSVVYATAEVLAARACKNASTVRGYMREFAGTRGSRGRALSTKGKRKAYAGPKLLNITEKHVPGERSTYYDLTPLWRAVEAVDVSDAFPEKVQQKREAAAQPTGEAFDRFFRLWPEPGNPEFRESVTRAREAFAREVPPAEFDSFAACLEKRLAFYERSRQPERRRHLSTFRNFCADWRNWVSFSLAA